MFLKKLVSHSLIYAIGPQIPKIAGLFVLPVITSYLTSADYGIYGVIGSYTGILAALSELGFSILLVNSFYSFPARWPIIWKQLHFYLIIWSVVYGLLLALLLYLIIPQEAREQKWLIILYVCAPSMLFNSTLVIGTRYYQFAQKPMFVSITSAIVGVAAIGLNLYTIAFLKLGYMGWFISSFISGAIQFLFFLYPVFFKYKLAPIWVYRKRFLLRNLKVSLPSIPHNYSSYLLNSSDRMIMDRTHLPVEAIGKYNLAYIFGNYFEFFSLAVGMAVGPFYTSLISKKNEEQDKQIHFITHWLQYGFLIAGFLICIWCKELLNFLISNKELKLVYPIAIIIIMSYVSRPYYWVVVNKLQFFEETIQFWKISFIAGVLNIILNIFLIPFFGIKAAALTTFFALLYMNFAGHFLPAYKKIEKADYYPLTMIFINIGALAIAYLIKDATPLLKISVTICCLVFMAVYTSRNVNILKKIEV